MALIRATNPLLCLLLFVILYSILAFNPTSAATGAMNNFYTDEAHVIMKRLAKGDKPFDNHDVAKVHLIQDQSRNQSLHGSKRRLSRRDINAAKKLLTYQIEGPRVLELELSSGSKVSLVLKPAGIVDSDTQLSFRSERGYSSKTLDELGGGECYFYGEISDSSGQGTAAVSHCDGLFGFATSQGFEYFLHPVEKGVKELKRFKRSSKTDDDFDVHILWRRSTRNDNSSSRSTSSTTDTNVRSAGTSDEALHFERSAAESAEMLGDTIANFLREREAQNSRNGEYDQAEVDRSMETDTNDGFEATASDEIDGGESTNGKRPLNNRPNLRSVELGAVLKDSMNIDPGEQSAKSKENLSGSLDMLRREADGGNSSVIENGDPSIETDSNEGVDLEVGDSGKLSGISKSNTLHRKRNSRRVIKRSAEDRRVVIEIAMFSDKEYVKIMEELYPGRINDFLLTRLAGTQALFSNREDVGYDVQIKVKLLEHWKKNPKEYKFGQKLSTNMKSFCHYVRDKYEYDLYAINTGIVDNGNGNVGLAYLKGMCTRVSCFASLATRLSAFVVYAHEIGHTMGISHDSGKCPAELQTIGGFMGGGPPYNFSPCMRYLFDQFVKSPKGQCLLEETSETFTSPEFNKLNKYLPGQVHQPNQLCELLAGAGYKYVPIAISTGKPMCRWMVCLNEDESSPEYGRARRFSAPIGFPCDHESFCSSQVCNKWDDMVMTLDAEKLKHLTNIPQWSEWTTEMSKCSRSCGTGIRSRRRECLYTGLNLAPYCSGDEVQAELCNTDPCPDDPTGEEELRQARGKEFCKRFKENRVKIGLGKAKGYLPKLGVLTTGGAGANIRKVVSSSCLVTCERVPSNIDGELDGFMPDGTPCFETNRSKHELSQMNIQLRCVRGICMDFML